jgi:hypothetical protein
MTLQSLYQLYNLGLNLGGDAYSLDATFEEASRYTSVYAQLTLVLVFWMCLGAIMGYWLRIGWAAVIAFAAALPILALILGMRNRYLPRWKNICVSGVALAVSVTAGAGTGMLLATLRGGLLVSGAVAGSYLALYLISWSTLRFFR